MIKEKIAKFPHKPWIYLWKKWNKVLYVGKAKDLNKRVHQYFRTWIWVWKEDMVSKATDIEYLLTRTEEEALILENNLIKKYSPAYNCLLKWDNSYTYIRITQEDFPKIEFTRYKDKPWTYIWPKPWKKDTKNILQILRQILRFRTCSTTKFNKWQLCSDFTLWLCAGRCAYGYKWWIINDKWKRKIKIKENSENKNNQISFDSSEQTYQISSINNWKSNVSKISKNLQISLSEYKKIVKIIIDFFNWKTNPVKKLIKEKIEQAIEKQNFEYANILKNTYFKLERLTEKQTIELDEKITGYFVKIKEQNNIYFMIYAKFIDWKLIDLVKLKNNENNFLENMLQDWLISTYEELGKNYYFAK